MLGQFPGDGDAGEDMPPRPPARDDDFLFLFQSSNLSSLFF
jgi:hypothetical protein